MKVAVWTDERLGPAVVCIPSTKGPSDIAHIPHCPPGPIRQWTAKGDGVSWSKWTAHLADRLPYHGQWSEQEVPDGMTAKEALWHLRESDTERRMTKPD